MAVFLLVVHLAASLVLAAYGCHRLFLALAYRFRVAPRPRRVPAEPARLPSVTVQIPLYNERYVAARALAAAAALDYPRELLEIQVLDDSTDETTAVVAAAAAGLRSRGVVVHHERRNTRRGFKAGALGYGLRRARGELVAVFDADFVPRPDFLRRLVGEFADPRVGMVQARWGHLNADSSLLTRIQALQLDAHFTVEHGTRAAIGWFFNFNGTAGIWRKQTIETSGGWRADTLTEDLDLSYRAQLRGWRFVYRDDVEVPAEVPVEVAGYRVQQQRWAQGGVQTALKLLPSIVRAPLTRGVKCEAFWHLTGHLSYLVLIVLALAGIGGGVLSGADYRPWLAMADAALVGFATASLSVFYGVAAAARGGPRWWWRLGLVVPIMVVGAGIALGQAAAVLRAVARRPTPFRRTPKYRQVEPHDRSWRTGAYRISTFGSAFAECLGGLAIVALVIVAATSEFAYPSGPVLLIGAGFAGIGSGAMLQHPPRRRSPATVPTG